MRNHQSKNGLRPSAKHVSVDVLNSRLADAIDLSLLTKQAHWNVKGPHFIALHEMFDKFRDDLDTHVDAMAERIVQLGGTALGTSQSVVHESAITPYPTDIYAGDAHLSALQERYGALGDAVRAAIDQTSAAGDADTADILTGFSRSLDKSLWFVEAHIHNDAQHERQRPATSLPVAVPA